MEDEIKVYNQPLERRIGGRGPQLYGFYGLTDFSKSKEITNPNGFPYKGKIEVAHVENSIYQARYTTPDGKLKVYGSDCSMDPLDSLRVVVQGLVARGYDNIPLKD